MSRQIDRAKRVPAHRRTLAQTLLAEGVSLAWASQWSYRMRNQLEGDLAEEDEFLQRMLSKQRIARSIVALGCVLVAMGIAVMYFFTTHGRFVLRQMPEASIFAFAVGGFAMLAGGMLLPTVPRTHFAALVEDCKATAHLFGVSLALRSGAHIGHAVENALIAKALELLRSERIGFNLVGLKAEFNHHFTTAKEWGLIVYDDWEPIFNEARRLLRLEIGAALTPEAIAMRHREEEREWSAEDNAAHLEED